MSFVCRRSPHAPRRNAGALACLVAVAASLGAARAQNYPSHPITLVVPFTAGTGYDVIGRVVGAKLSQRLGEPFVVEDRPGASASTISPCSRWKITDTKHHRNGLPSHCGRL